MPKTQRQILGAWGEEQASLFLIRQGYKIISRNYTPPKGKGDLDIIAWHDKHHFGKTLCFVEVKTRSSEVGSAERATRGEKLKHIFRVARWYCIEYDINVDAVPIQFEQVSIYLNEKTKKVKLKKYEIPVD